MFVSRYKNKNAFTLTELIIVIVILAILWAISFIAMESYSKNSRDSVRISWISSISTAIEMFAIETWFYPVPSEWTEITFSWAEVWTQGTIWKSVVDQVDALSDSLYSLVDPITQTPYTYSRLNSKDEFQIASAIEGEISFNDYNILVPQAFAASGQVVSAYVKGTYNWVAARVSTWETAYVLAIPSIVSSDLSITDVVNYIDNNKFVYHGFQNLPDVYRNSVFEVDGGSIEYKPKAIVVYSSGSFDALDEVSVQLQLLKNLQEAYSGSLVVNSEALNRNIQLTPIDLESPSSNAEYLACNISKYILRSGECEGSFSLPWEWVSGSCDLQPSIDNAVFHTWSPTSTGQVWVYDEAWSEDCSWLCNVWYMKGTWESCEVDLYTPYCESQPTIDNAVFNEGSPTATGQVWVYDEAWSEDCSWLCDDGYLKGAWESCVSPYCDSQPSIDHAVFNEGSPTSTGQVWVYDEVWSEDCSWLCEDGYLKGDWDECVIDISPYCDTEPTIDWAIFNEGSPTATGQVWIFDDSATAACSWKCEEWKVKGSWDTCVLEGAITWNGAWDGVNWTNPDNWDLDRVPEESDTVIINMNVNVYADTSWGIEVWNLRLWETATSTLTLSGLGSFTANWEVHIYTWDKITHDYNTSSKSNILALNTSNLTIDSWGFIDVSGRGYIKNEGPWTWGYNSRDAWGWAYWGNWANWADAIAVGWTWYWSVSEPDSLWSWGAGGNWWNWGGSIKLTVSWTATINWSITANWNNYSGYNWWWWAWGSIWLNANSIAWVWSISANWGNWHNRSSRNCWGWSGWRIAIYYNSSTFSNGYIYTNPWSGYMNWWVWTFYTKNKTSSDESIYVRTNGTTTSTFTELTSTLSTLDYMYVGLWAHMLWRLNIPNASLTINNGWTISHEDNSTTKDYTVNIIVANLTIDSGGTIDVSWLGYDRNQWQGKGLYNSYDAWGGSYWWNWANWADAIAEGWTWYWSATIPNDLWSWWGWDSWWYWWGSVKLVISWATIINWTIKANWTSYSGYNWWGGAWGSIWIDTNSLAWAWTISTNWGNWHNRSSRNCWGWAGWRIALYYNSSSLANSSISTNPWTGYKTWGVGTLYMYDKSDTSKYLYVRNTSSATVTPTLTELEGSITSVKSIYVGQWAYVWKLVDVVASSIFDITSATILIDEVSEFNMPSVNVNVHSGWKITHSANGATKDNILSLISANLTIDSWWSIDVSWVGYARNEGQGKWLANSYDAWGWAYWANWANWADAETLGGTWYWSVSEPNELWSWGGWSVWWSWGWSIKLIVSWATIINWTIEANWTNYSGYNWWGGAWGSIWIDTSSLAWAWTISTNWGNWHNRSSRNCWGWSGGRIALYYNSSTFLVASIYTNPWTGYRTWGVGTIYTKNKTSSDESIYVRTSWVTTSVFTELTSTFNTLDYMYVGQWAYMLWQLNIPNASLYVNNWWIITHKNNSTSKVSDVDIIATNLTIDSGGTIDVSWFGYDKGQWTWSGASNIYDAWGGAYWWNWANWADSVATGWIWYGSISEPNELWSWGGWSDWWSWGWSIKLAISWNTTVNWTIKANWNNYSGYNWWGGAGGSIRINTDSLAWGWTISSNGWNWNNRSSRNCWGGWGWRIAILFNDFTLPITSIYTNPWSGYRYWGVGTLYTKNKTSSYESIYVRTSGSSTSTFTEITSTLSSLDYMYVGQWAYVLWQLNIPNASLTISNWWTISHEDNSTTKASTVNIIATNLTIDSGGTIDVSWLGYDKNEGQWKGLYNSYDAWGGSYWGNWWDWADVDAIGGTWYWSLTSPEYLWSWGGWASWWYGWWSIKLAISWDTTINWTIKANWTNYSGYNWWGGAWGSIWIDTTSIAWAWTISSNGWNWNNRSSRNCWGWSGWRIAIYYDFSSYDSSNITTYWWAWYNVGWAGTIYIKDNASAYWDLYIVGNQTSAKDTLTEIDGLISIVNNLYIWWGASVNKLLWGTVNELLEISKARLTIWASMLTTSNADIDIKSWGIFANETSLMQLSAQNFSIDSAWLLSVEKQIWSAIWWTDASNNEWWGGAYGANWANWESSIATWWTWYGSITNPTLWWSKWWNTNWGLWGWRIKLIIAQNTVLNWYIRADWDNWWTYWGWGSWWSIRIDTNNLSWAWGASANWWSWYSSSGYNSWGGAGWRIAIYYNSSTFNVSNVTTYWWWGYKYGWVWTFYIKDKGAAYWDLYVRWSRSSAQEAITTLWGPTTLKGLYIYWGANIEHSWARTISDSFEIGASKFTHSGVSPISVSSWDVHIKSGGYITHEDNSSGVSNSLSITALNFTIDSGWSINVSWKGYGAKFWIWAWRTDIIKDEWGWGGYWWRWGSWSTVFSKWGITYWVASIPNYLGSWWWNDEWWSWWWMVKLTVGSSLVLNWSISANWSWGGTNSWGWSWWSIRIIAGSYSGNWSLSASWGWGCNSWGYYCGWWGGWRISTQWGSSSSIAKYVNWWYWAQRWESWTVD